MAHESASRPEHDYQIHDGRLTLGENGVIALRELTNEVKDTLLSSLEHTSDYAKFRDEDEISYTARNWAHEIRDGNMATFPITGEINEINLVQIETYIYGTLLGDNCQVTLFNTVTKKMVCVGFGPELTDEDRAVSDNDDFRFSFGFVADYGEPGIQDVKIYVSTSDRTDFKDALLPQIEP